MNVGYAVFRVLLKSFDQNKRNTVNDKRYRNDLVVIEMLVKEIVELYAENSCRKNANDNLTPDVPYLFFLLSRLFIR